MLADSLISHGSKAVLPEPALVGSPSDGWGKEAYIYGYPLVTIEMTRRVMTNVAEPKGTHGPMRQFVKMRQYPTAAFKDVTAPNADTLYTVAWLDLSKEPWVLSLPDMKGRYYPGRQLETAGGEAG